MRQWRSLIDLILLWVASIAILRLGMGGHISAETGAMILFGVLLVVAFTRIAGSNVFREKSRIPKFFISQAKSSAAFRSSRGRAMAKPSGTD